MRRKASSEGCLALLGLMLIASPGAAQLNPAADWPADSVITRRSSFPWLHAGLAALGAVAIVGVDQPMRRFLQNNRTPLLDGLSDGARQGGQWQFHLVLPVAVALTGAVVGDPGILHAGLDLGASTLVTAVAVTALKYGFGRERPLCLCGSLEFEPFGSGQSLPSGHTAAAFAAATTLAGHVDRKWMRIGLYGAATLVGWSRMNDDRHWLSDVVAGAAIGVAAGRLTRGRFGGQGRSRPTLARHGDWTSVGWTVTF